jgi:hypothetical protein
MTGVASFPPSRSLRLDQAAAACLVLRGEVQLFAVAPGRDGAAEGVRRPLGVVGPGGLLLGAGPSASGDALLATTAAGTELLPFDPAISLAAPPEV